MKFILILARKGEEAVPIKVNGGCDMVFGVVASESTPSGRVRLREVRNVVIWRLWNFVLMFRENYA
jgi:hypothetical protein